MMLRPHALNAFQCRLPALFVPPGPVPGYSKTVGLIPDMLDQVQRGRISRHPEHISSHGVYQLLHACTTGYALGDTNQWDVRNLKLIKDFPGNIQLPLTTVYEDQIRALALASHHSLVAT